MNEKLRFILMLIQKKLHIILIVGIICSGGILAEKIFFQPSVPITGRMIFTEVVRLDRSKQLVDEDGNIKDISISPIVNMWSNKQKFLDKTESQFDYSRFDKNWDNFQLEQKFSWIDKHIRLKLLGNDTYEFVLEFKAEDAKDSDYVKKVGSQFLDEFIDYSNDVSSIILGNADVQVIDTYQFENTHENATNGKILLKYAIIGFVLGCLVSCTVIVIMGSRAKSRRA